jgi:cyclopropane fatty-acyl-phospholipid synthase-like methyltransferase
MPHPDLRHAYDALAKTYDANRGAFDMSAVLADLFARLPPVPGQLLDLGCGAGEPVAAAFIQRGWQVTGVDLSPAMLALAERYVPAMQRVLGDMCSVELPTSHFDVVTAIYSLFHVPRAEHPALFARIYNWLRPGGTLLFTYATQAYTGAERFEGTRTFLGQELFYSHLTPVELTGQVTGAGLTVADMRERDIGGERFLWVTAAKHVDSRGRSYRAE